MIGNIFKLGFTSIYAQMNVPFIFLTEKIKVLKTEIKVKVLEKN